MGRFHAIIRMHLATNETQWIRLLSGGGDKSREDILFIKLTILTLSVFIFFRTSSPDSAVIAPLAVSG